MNHVFGNLIEHLNNLMDQLSEAHASFSVYEAIQESKATNLLGEKVANENVKTMNDYGGFFVTIESAIFMHFILTLAKFFDNDLQGQSLSIFRIIKFIQDNRIHLSVVQFTEYYKDRQQLEGLAKNYTGVSDELISEIESKIQEIQPMIDKIKILRDKYFAHNDIKKSEVHITPKEIFDIFNAVEEIMGKICSEVMREGWVFNHIKQEIKTDTLGVIEHLRRFKPYHLEERTNAFWSGLN